MYQPNYGYQYPYYGSQPPMPDNLAQLRMNTSQMQNAVVQPSMPSQPMQVQQPNNGLIWVQGESGAKSYLVAPNATIMLMDSECERFYLKSADASGMPLPLRIFDYKERQNAPTSDFKAPTSDFSELDGKYITREEFEQRMAAVSHTCKCKEKPKKNNLTEDATDGE